MGTTTSNLESLMDQYDLEKTSSTNGSNILRHKGTGNVFLLRQVSTASQTELNTLVQRVNRRKDLIHEHYLTLQQTFQRSEGTFCSTLHRFSLLYQYGKHTLQHEIETRMDQSRRFEEKELWSIICSCVLALAFLNRNNIEYEVISPSDIFLDNEGIVKIPDPDLSSGTFNGAFSNRSSNYFSPQSLQGRHNPDKSCIFSLGMCVLEAMFMESMSICYNPQDGRLDQKELGDRIGQMKSAGEYNQTLMTTVENMLAIDPKKRPTILELEERLFTLLTEDTLGSSKSFQPSTPVSTGAVEMKNGDKEVDNDVVSEKLHSMAPEKEETPCIVIQLFQEVDIENPDDAEDKDKEEGPLTERSNTGPNNVCLDQKGYKNSQKQKQQQQISQLDSRRENQNNNPKDDLFTDPRLLEMLRKDIEEIHLRKSRQVNTSSSTVDYSLKVEAPRASLNPSRQLLSPLSQPKAEPPSSLEIRLVNQTYARGRYEGEKRGSVREGYGTFYYKEGGKYIGSWKNNKMHGKGTLYYANDKMAYDGDWIEDHLWGRGTLYNQDPQKLLHSYNYKSFDGVDEFWVKYEGQFVDDNKCGRGKLVLSNNEVFEGEFNNDSIEGEGVFVTEAKRVVRGEWRENRMVRQAR